MRENESEEGQAEGSPCEDGIKKGDPLDDSNHFLNESSTRADRNMPASPKVFGRKMTVYKVKIDPSNNIFYASKAGDGLGYNHYKILMTNNSEF